jgi:integrase
LECTLLKQIVKWLIDEGTLPSTQRIRLELRRSHESSTYCYTREQIRSMLSRCRSEANLGWLGDVIVALATTGMRIGELADLRWSDIDLKAGVITLSDNRHNHRARSAGAVRTTKGRRTRRIDVHASLREVLVRQPHREQGGFAMRGHSGGRLDPDKVLKVLKRDIIGPLKTKFPTPAGEIGFADGGVHSFRHYFVTEALLGGATEGEVRDWVGHRDSRIVERYRHLRDRSAKDRMQKLNFLGGEPEGKASPEQENKAPHPGQQMSDGSGADDKTRETEGPNGSAPR